VSEPMERKRVMSGMRPTGALHIGHLVGALKNWVELQDEFDCFYGVVDWHALTTHYEDPKEIERFSREVAMDYLAAGIDPERSVLFLQSQVKEHAELHLLLSMVTPVSWLERVPTYKDQVREQKAEGRDVSTYGFLGYPLLQGADIMIYKAHVVPVGEDQLPHLELVREVCRRFNHLYGRIFPEPQGRLTKFPGLPGLDGRKMSKSYENDITIAESPEETKEKVMNAVTDPARVRRKDPGHPEVCTVYAYYRVFAPEAVQERNEECRKASVGCVECKEELARILNDYLEPIRERRRRYEMDLDEVDEVLADGSRRARKYAEETMAEVRAAMRLWPT